ncbi:hypothetical protein COHA_008643 [Chlorella ohadii]|uniref:Uncharacterized protein n=1 Tax=Chlorella ohadii TaxID=2649997 RepID=A0AAD5DGZ3_9CHLO|nr:hypothetical protein COHA_008643 [Chlorella ohadii]
MRRASGAAGQPAKVTASQPPSTLRATARPRRLPVFVKAQAEPEPDAFSLGQPQVLPEPGRYLRPEQLDAVAAPWRPWVEQQYAALQSIAGGLRSFTAVSWQHLGPAAGPLRLVDFLALLNPEQLQEVSLVLSGSEPLPVDALAMLARFPQLRSLSIQHDIDAAANDEEGRQAEALAAAALCDLKQLTSLSLEMGYVPHTLVTAAQCLPQLERLQIVGQASLLPESADFPRSFPHLRHLHLAPAWGEIPLPRPADFPSLQSFVYEERAPGTDYATLEVQGQKGGSMRSGQWVRFQDGELAVVDRDSDQEGIENLQAFVDAMLPAGQELRALVMTKVGQTYQFAPESHTCRQLATTTRLELRQCFMHFPMLLRQAPNLHELVMERCAQRNEDELYHSEGEEAGDEEEEEEQDPLTWHAVPAAALPASLTRLCLMGTNLIEHELWPAMPDLQQLGLSYATFRTLIHLQPCPLASAPNLRHLRLGESTKESKRPVRYVHQWQLPMEVSMADVEALVAALPGLRELELYSLASNLPPAAPEVLQRLHSLAPHLAVRTVFLLDGELERLGVWLR